MLPSLKIIFATTSVVICLSLTACSGAPSEGELKSAIENKMQADSKAMESAIGQQGMPARPVITAVHKNSCKNEGNNTYTCTVELEVMQNGTATKGTAIMRFAKNGDKWTATK